MVGPSPSGDGPVPSLARFFTRRELQVLELAANGHTNWAIGRTLGIAEDTVKTRMQAILRKLNVPNRTQAATVGIRLGLIGMDQITIPRALVRVEREDV
jgi:DNA-binding NarL/FixJ family response regulator